MKAKTIIDVTTFETLLGPMIACGTEQGICLLEFTDRKLLDSGLKNLAQKLNGVLKEGDNPYFKNLQTQLSEYFDGKRKQFDIPIFTPGTAFQNLVWQQLQTIPYGHTRTYKEQAVALGSAGAIRAVAAANGMNRIAVMVPCHRVIGSNGNLTGYAAGLWRKKHLLELEAVNAGYRMF